MTLPPNKHVGKATFRPVFAAAISSSPAEKWIMTQGIVICDPKVPVNMGIRVSSEFTIMTAFAPRLKPDGDQH